MELIHNYVGNINVENFSLPTSVNLQMVIENNLIIRNNNSY